MLVAIFLTSLLALCVNSEHNKYPLDIEGLHKLQRENGNVDSYLHTREFFDAVHVGKKYFEKTELKENLDETVGNYENLSKQAYHTTTVKTALFPDNNYFSLDNTSVSNNIQSIDAVSLIDCNSNNVRIGDYYIGTDASSHSDISLHSNQGSKVGFIFSRQVVRVNYVGPDCKHVLTAVVHPLQLMDTQIETAVHFPYDRIYIPNYGTQNRNLRGDTFIEPDAPLLVCSDDKVTSKMATIHKTGEDSTTIKGVPFDYSYALDVKGNECLYAATTVPGSINYNHASGTNAIRQNIVLGNGATCTNCYSFIGASILAVFNIFGGQMSTFAFEAKDGGGAGFNIGILIKDPSFSAAKYLKLAGPGAASSIPIVAGLSLDIKFGGAWATIKGSGAATGEARFSSGYTLYEEDSIMYAKSKWSATHKLTNLNQLKPVYTTSGFKVSSTSLSLIVALSARIEFSFGGSIPVVNVGATIDFSSILTATAQFVKKGQCSLTEYKMLLDFSEADSRFLLDNNINTNKKYSGDKIRFKVRYEGFNPNEEHELYLNLHHSLKHSGYPIAKRNFKSSKTGKGIIVVDWTVPYDSVLMQRDTGAPEQHFSVHSSARLDRFYSGKKVKLLQRPGLSVFQYPRDGSIVPIDKNITIKWDKNVMKYFRHRPGTDGMGEDKVSLKVSIIIVSKEGNDAYQVANNIDNNGAYRVKLPEILRYLGKRFFLVIHDSNEYSKMAWHYGTFQLAPSRNRMPLNGTAELPYVYVEPPVLDNGLPLWGLGANSSLTIPKIQTRRLDTSPSNCPNSALSLLLQVEFGFDGFTLLGKKYTLGSTHSNPFTLIPQKNFCL